MSEFHVFATQGWLFEVLLRVMDKLLECGAGFWGGLRPFSRPVGGGPSL